MTGLVYVSLVCSPIDGRVVQQTTYTEAAAASGAHRAAEAAHGRAGVPAYR